MSRGYRSGHLGDAVDLYVDGELDAASMRCAARHLLVCATCRGEVDAERAIVREVRAVRVDPDRHASLVAGLLALAPECHARGTQAASTPHAAAPADPSGSTADPSGRASVVSAAPRVVASGSMRPPQRRAGRRVVVALGSFGALLTVAGAGFVAVSAPGHPSPVAPERARTTLVGTDRLTPPTVDVLASRIVAHGEGMTVSRARSGRMDP